MLLLYPEITSLIKVTSAKELRMQEDLSCGLVRKHLTEISLLICAYIICLIGIILKGTWRVGGVLAVSRAFGDRLLKQYVVADPEIQEEKVDSSLEFLILASDGLWDVVSNEVGSVI
jgi:hypothetical protein